MAGNAKRRAAVIGYPIAHSRSPLIHGYWLAELGIDGTYERIEVKPGTVEAALRALGRDGYAGGNVTVPHKEEAFAACDVVSNSARALGAVNTFWFEGETLCGDNTDGIGFLAHLNDVHPGWNETPRDILILGAGGAARGILLPLIAQKPASITLTNRSEERLEALLGNLDSLDLTVPVGGLPWDKRKSALDRFGLIINTTSLGMSGKPALELPLDTVAPGTIIADIVYSPLETALLAEARAKELPVLDGLGMLLHQAVPGFERWFGTRPRVTSGLRDRIVADLTAKA